VRKEGKCKKCKKSGEVNKHNLCKKCDAKKRHEKYLETYEGKVQERLKKKQKKISPLKDKQSLLNSKLITKKQKKLMKEFLEQGG